MDRDILDAEVKTRIPKAHKKRLQAIAIARHLKLADILREAIREKLSSDANAGKSKYSEEVDRERHCEES
jgi:hypothetical protein